MPKILTVIFVVFLFISKGYGQRLEFKVIIADYETQDRLKTAFINLYSDSLLIKSIPVDKNGSVEVILESKGIYTIEACNSGKVSRFVLCDLTQMQSTSDSSMELFGGCEISLFDIKPDIDYSFFKENPITTFSYDFEQNQLVFDYEIAVKMRDNVELLMKSKVLLNEN